MSFEIKFQKYIQIESLKQKSGWFTYQCDKYTFQLKYKCSIYSLPNNIVTSLSPHNGMWKIYF